MNGFHRGPSGPAADHFDYLGDEDTEQVNPAQKFPDTDERTFISPEMEKLSREQTQHVIGPEAVRPADKVGDL